MLLDSCKLCAPYSECWGSDARDCENSELMDTVARREHTWLGQKWMVKWRDSCISSWECLIEINHLPLFTGVGVGESVDNILFTFDIDNNKVEIPEYGYKLKNKMNLHIFEDPWNITRDTQNTTCISEENIGITCLWKNPKTEGNTPFLMNPTHKKTVVRNTLISLQSMSYVDPKGQVT